MLWDLDGTLADSRDYHWRSWREVMGVEGLVLSHEQFLASFGQRNDTILREWLGDGVSATDIQRIGNAKESRFRGLVGDEGLAALPGAAEWLRRLAGAGWRQAIASSAPRLNVEAMIHALGLEELVDRFVAAEDVHRGKPDPEVFLLAARRLAVPPAACVVVEDAAAGVEAGRRAGMRTIGLGIAAADIEVPSLADLPADAFDRLVRPP